MTIITDFSALTVDQAIAIFAAVEAREDFAAAAKLCLHVDDDPRVDSAYDAAAARANADEARQHRGQLCEDLYACADAIRDQPDKAHEHLLCLRRQIETEERIDNEETGAVAYLLAAVLRAPWLR